MANLAQEKKRSNRSWSDDSIQPSWIFPRPGRNVVDQDAAGVAYVHADGFDRQRPGRQVPLAAEVGVGDGRWAVMVASQRAAARDVEDGVLGEEPGGGLGQLGVGRRHDELAQDGF